MGSPQPGNGVAAILHLHTVLLATDLLTTCAYKFRFQMLFFLFTYEKNACELSKSKCEETHNVESEGACTFHYSERTELACKLVKPFSFSCDYTNVL